MSHSIDERVVEMRFNNKQFEEETRKTMSTLERLKEALKFTKSGEALKGLEKNANSIRLDGIAASVDMLAKRFSTFGIIGMRVIQNITDAFMGKLAGAINYVSDAIVSGGIKRAFNIENAHFQLQALLKDETKVQAVMANAMEAVDGTAYAYDEAAKAASQFAASGIEAGDDMLNALKGITGVAAMTNSDFESIAMIFTTVAGNGRLMGDQLLQLSSRGLNAASTLVDYFKEVQGQANITEGEVRDMVSKGEISFKMFADAMTYAFGDSAKRANETFNGAMSNMRSAFTRIGAGFISPLIEQNGVLVDLFNSLRVKINEIKGALVFDSATSSVEGFAKTMKMSGDEAQDFYNKIKETGHVTTKNIEEIKKGGQDGYSVIADYMNKVSDGSIRTGYAVTSSIEEISKGAKVSAGDVAKFVKKGKVSYDIFSESFEHAFGTQHQKLSKRFTDFVIKSVDALRTWIDNTDLTKPMELFNEGIDILIHSLQAVGKVLSPVGTAFYNVFLKDFSFGIDNMLDAANGIDKLIQHFKLSESASKSLQQIFTGLFDVIALIGDAFLGLVGAILPFGKTAKEAGGGVLQLAGNLGQCLTNFTQFVRTSPKVQKGFVIFQKAVENVAKGLTTLGNGIWDFITMVGKLPQTKSIMKGVSDIFSSTGSIIETVCGTIVNSVGSFIDSLGKINFTNPRTMMKSFGDAVEDLAKSLMKYGSIRTFVTNFKEFLNNIGEAFSRDNIAGKINGVKGAFDTLGNGIKAVWGYLKPIFDQISLGGIAAAGTGVGIVASMYKISKSLEKVAESVKSVPNLLGAVKGTLEAYQKDLKAEQIKNIAAAIALLAGAVLLLSFADPKNVMASATALTMIAGALLGGGSALLNALNKTKTLPDVLNTFAKGISKSLNNLAKAVKWKAIGGAVKSLGETILMIGATIVVIALMWRRDPQAMDQALFYVGAIAAGIIGMITVMSAAGSIMGKGMKSFQKAATGVLEIAAAMFIIVASVDKIMKMEIPSDFESRMDIFKDVFSGLMILTIVVAAASRLAGGKSLSLTGPIVGLCAMLMTSVSSLKKLFKMDVPNDWKRRFLMLEGIFASLAGITLAVAAAARIAGGNKIGSATGPILALCALLATATASLKKVMNMKLPDDWLVRFGMLEVMFITLGSIMKKIGASVKEGAGGLKAAGSILAMCALLATATGSLMILSMISWPDLMKGAVALGIVLVGLAVDLTAVGEITNGDSYKAVLALAATVGAITASLAVLSMISVPNLVKAGAALGAMLLALAADFYTVSKISNEKVFADILVMVGAMAAVVAALVILANQPWEGLIAGGVSLGLVLTALAAAFTIISKCSDVKMDKIAMFTLAALALLPMAVAIAVLANQPWQGMITATASLATLMLSMAAALGIIAKCKVNIGAAIDAVVSLDIFLANLIGVLAILGKIEEKFEGRLSTLIGEGGGVLGKIGEAFGQLISGFGKGLASQLPSIGLSLSAFAIAILPFITVMNGIKQEAVDGTDRLLTMVLKMASASVISAITNLLTLGNGFKSLGKKLVEFGDYIKQFADKINGINPISVIAAAAAGNMIASLYDSLPKSGGWMQTIFGETMSLKTFGTQLEAFGDAIVPFAEKVAGIDSESVKGALAAGETMAGLYDSLPKKGGWMQTIFGETMSLKTFGTQLEAFGDAVVPFADRVKGVKKSAVKGAAAVGEMMADLANKLPKEGGLMRAIFGGTTDLGTFGSQLRAFGNYAVSFSNRVKNIKTEAVTGAANVARMMSNIANELPQSNNILEKWFGGGKVTLKEFGKQLADFAPYLVSFSEDVKSISESDVSGAMGAVTIITSTLEAITQQESVKTSLTSFGQQLEKFGKSLTKFYKEMKNTDFSNVTTITANIKKLVSVATETGSKTVTSFTKAFNNVGGSVKTAVNKMITAAINALKASNARFKATGKIAGTNFIDGLSAGIRAGTTKIKTQGKNLGKDYVSGFAQGIRANTSLATAAAKALADKVDKQVANSLEIHSPSRKAIYKGKMYTEGFALGMAKSMEPVIVQTKRLANIVNRTLDVSLDFGKTLRNVQHFASMVNKSLDISISSKALVDKLSEINIALYGLSKPAQFVAAIIEEGFLKMEQRVTTAYKNIDKAQKEYAKVQSQQQKDEEKRQKLEEKQKEEYEKWVDYYSKSAKERAEAAKEAKKQAAIEAKAYAKVYGSMKATKQDFEDFNDKYYKKMVKLVRTGNNKILYEDKTLEEAQIDILQRVTDAYNTYMDQYKQTRDQFMNQIGFFDEVSSKAKKDISVSMFSEVSKSEAKTKEELFQIANDQITLYTDFVTTQNALLEKLDGTTLADYIRGLGVDSYEQLKVINAMTAEELQAYADVYQTTYDSIAAATKTDILTKETLIKNARDQVQLYEEFVKSQQAIMARLDGTALGDYVNTLGIDSKEEIDAILTMTDVELSEYVKLYDQKFAMAGVAAKNQLTGTQAEIEQQILDILQGIVTKVNLWDWNFDGTMESLVGSTKNAVKKGKKEAKSTIADYGKAIAKYGKESIGVPLGGAMALGFSASNIETVLKKKGEMVEVVESVVKETGKKNKPVAKKQGKEVAEEGIKGVKSMGSNFFAAGAEAGKKLADGLKSQAAAVKAAAEELQKAAQLQQMAAANLGAATSAGMASGMTSSSGSVHSAGRGLGSSALSGIAASLSIHSPSRKAIKLGDYTVLGFISGLMKKIAEVAKSGERIGETAVSSIETGMSDIYRVFDDLNFEWSPVIRPTVDMTGIEKSTSDIQALFNDAIRSIQSDVAFTYDVLKRNQVEPGDGDTREATSVVNNYTFNQENYSPKALSNIDIYRSTNNQFAKFRQEVSLV